MLATLILTAALGVPAPAQEGGDTLAERLRANRFFKELAWVREDGCAPLVLFVQKHPVDRPNYAASLVNFYGAWLAELARVFEDQVAAPAGLARSEEQPLDAVFLLLSEGDYFNYCKVVPAAKSYGHFDPRLGLTVSYEDMSGHGAPHHRRGRVMRPFVEGLLRAYYSGEGARPSSWFVREGLTGFLVTHLGHEPSALARRQIEPRTLDALYRVIVHPEQHAIYLSSVEELLAAPDSSSAWSGVWQRAKGTGQKAKSSLFGDTTLQLPALWMHYLTGADEGARRAACFQFLGAAMRGESALEAFRAAYPDPIELERGFWRWVLTENQRVNGAALTYDEAVIDRLLALHAAVEVTEDLAAAAGGADDEPWELDPDDLRPDAHDALVRHALALQRALAGDLEGALADIETLLVDEAEGPIGRRLQREATRLRELARVRDGYLEDVAAAGGKLKLTRGDDRRSFTVVRFADGVVHFDGRRELESLPVSEIPPYDLAVEMSKHLSGSDDAWLRYYVYVLAGDERWERLMKGDAPERVALRTDANEWYPGLLRLGRVARTLEQLAETGLPEDAVEAQRALETVKRLVSDHRSLQVVEARLGALRSLAAGALAHFFDPAALSQAVGGRFERLEGERVRLTYEFDSPAEAADFRADHDYLRDWRQEAASLVTPASEAGYEVRAGALVGKGSVGYRHIFRFSAPMSLRAELRFGRVPSGAAPEAFLWFGLCADAKAEEAYVLAGAFGSLAVRDLVNRFNRQAWIEEMQIYPEQTYEYSFVHTGDELGSYVDGESVKTLEAGPLRSGGLLIMAHSDTTIRILRLEITGVLSSEEFARLEREWVEGELTSMGL